MTFKSKEFDTTLRLYAVVRSDLDMPPGKLAAQAGHAFLESFMKADVCVRSAYRDKGLGTKITLQVSNLTDLLHLHQTCIIYNVPCKLIKDYGHVMLPHFDGTPVYTALGIGPILKSDKISIFTSILRKV